MNDWRSSDLSGALENGRTCSKLDSWIFINNRIQRFQTCKQYKRSLQEQNHSNWKEPRIERPFKLYTMQENAAAIVRIKATAPFICCVRKQIQFIFWLTRIISRNVSTTPRSLYWSRVTSSCFTWTENSQLLQRISSKFRSQRLQNWIRCRAHSSSSRNSQLLCPRR